MDRDWETRKGSKYCSSTWITIDRELQLEQESNQNSNKVWGKQYIIKQGQEPVEVQ